MLRRYQSLMVYDFQWLSVLLALCQWGWSPRHWQMAQWYEGWPMPHDTAHRPLHSSWDRMEISSHTRWGGRTYSSLRLLETLMSDVVIGLQVACFLCLKSAWALSESTLIYLWPCHSLSGKTCKREGSICALLGFELVLCPRSQVLLLLWGHPWPACWLKARPWTPKSVLMWLWVADLSWIAPEDINVEREVVRVGREREMCVSKKKHLCFFYRHGLENAIKGLKDS